MGETSIVSVMRFIGSLLDLDIDDVPITRDPGRLVDRPYDRLPPTTPTHHSNILSHHRLKVTRYMSPEQIVLRAMGCHLPYGIIQALSKYFWAQMSKLPL